MSRGAFFCNNVIKIARKWELEIPANGQLLEEGGVCDCHVLYGRVSEVAAKVLFLNLVRAALQYMVKLYI